MNTATERQITGVIKQLQADLRARGVVDLVHEIGVDAAGDDAVWVWIILADSPPGSARELPTSGNWSWEHRSRLRDQVREAFASHELPWAYVLFRTREEQDALSRHAGP